MRASTIMLAAICALVLGRWAHNKAAVDGKSVVAGVFVVLAIAFLDQGKTSSIARGFAWLFFAAVILGSDSPLTAIKVTPASTLPPAASAAV